MVPYLKTVFIYLFMNALQNHNNVSYGRSFDIAVAFFATIYIQVTFKELFKPGLENEWISYNIQYV